jgi:hypothetical protein
VGDTGISKWTITGTSPAGQKIRAWLTAFRIPYPFGPVVPPPLMGH